MMTIDIAKHAIKQIAEFIGSKNETTCKILWHGGEPLLWSVSNYESILSHINEVYPHIQWDYSIQTNLTLLTEEHIKIFKKYKVHISTSMDGYERAQRILSVAGGSVKLS
jgi:sulfatase maturation enzyme AslB (radical SAM superfamily)